MDGMAKRIIDGSPRKNLVPTLVSKSKLPQIVISNHNKMNLSVEVAELLRSSAANPRDDGRMGKSDLRFVRIAGVG